MRQSTQASSRAFSSEIPTFRLIDWRDAPLAAGWIGPKCSAFSETWRRTAFSFSTSTAALSRSSVEERTSISSASWLTLVPVSLKSNRCAISRRAWSTAFATSGIETSETMSNEKSCLAIRGHPIVEARRPPLLSFRVREDARAAKGSGL